MWSWRVEREGRIEAKLTYEVNSNPRRVKNAPRGGHGPPYRGRTDPRPKYAAARYVHAHALEADSLYRHPRASRNVLNDANECRVRRRGEEETVCTGCRTSLFTLSLCLLVTEQGQEVLGSWLDFASKSERDRVLPASQGRSAADVFGDAVKTFSDSRHGSCSPGGGRACRERFERHERCHVCFRADGQTAMACHARDAQLASPSAALRRHAHRHAGFST